MTVEQPQTNSPVARITIRSENDMQKIEVNKRNELSMKKDLELLYTIYKHRALSTAQVMRVRGLSKYYVYEKLDKLRERELIQSEQISGNYIPNQRRQGIYYRITTRGIQLLKEYGYQCNYNADELRVTKFRLPYLLTANDLYFSLRGTGWHFRESREIKNFHTLNRNDMLQGTLINPTEDKEYALYIFLKNVQYDTLYRIKQEIKRIPFENILVTTRGEPSFNSVIKAFTDKRDKLIKGGSIKVLPFGFAQTYLNTSTDIPERNSLLIKKLGIGIDILADSINKNVFDGETYFDYYDYIVRHNDQEKYFVDLLDNDLMKIEELLRYRKDDYERDGKKVLVLTSTAKGHINFHHQMLGNPEHIEYLTVNPNQIIALTNALSNKNDFE